MNAAEFNLWLRDPARRPLVMGILNVTPDSFSDGGAFLDPAAAAEHALAMEQSGADLIDVGGESTRPGSDPIDESEQVRRVVPVLRAIRDTRCDIAISIDTTRASVVEAALDAGADVVNDISAGRDDSSMFSVVARRKAPIVLMHMQGTPKTMQLAPAYDDVVAEVSGFLNERLINAGIHGIDPELILLDPGIGFGKALEHNLQLLRRLAELSTLSRPLVVGTSRKGFIGRVTGESETSHRLFGTAASVAWAVANRASIVRVHDVEPMSHVVKMIRAIGGGDESPPIMLASMRFPSLPQSP